MKRADYIRYYSHRPILVVAPSGHGERVDAIIKEIPLSGTEYTLVLADDPKNSFTAFEHNIFIPIRTVSNLKKEELLELLNMCYEQVFSDSGNDSFKNIEVVASEDFTEIGIKAKEFIASIPKTFKYGLTISQHGIDFSVDGSLMNITPMPVFAKLIEWGIDVFGISGESFVFCID